MRLVPWRIELPWAWLWPVAVALFAVFLVLQAPTDKVVGLIAQRLPALHLEGLSGRPWLGEADAAALRLGGKWLPLGQLRWAFAAPSPWPPQVAVRLELDATGHVFSGTLGIGIGGIEWRDVRTLAPAAIAHHWLPPGVALDGTLFFRAEALALGAAPVLRNVALTWREAHLSSAGALLSLGELRITANAGENGTVAGQISNEGGNLWIEGNWRYQAPQWHLKGRLRSAEPLSPAARRLLHDALGPSDADGYHSFNLSR